MELLIVFQLHVWRIIQYLRQRYRYSLPRKPVIKAIIFPQYARGSLL